MCQDARSPCKGSHTKHAIRVSLTLALKTVLSNVAQSAGAETSRESSGEASYEVEEILSIAIADEARREQTGT